MSLKITAQPVRLKFRFPFKIAHGERTYTDAVIVCAESGRWKGFGEATLPPYLPDTVQSVMQFLKHPFFLNIRENFHLEEIFDEMEQHFAGNMPAKAAVDMALWQLKAQRENKTLAQLLQTENGKSTPHTYTIGICTKAEMEQRLKFGIESGFTFFKLKLDGTNDEEIIRNYVSLCEYPFAVDANQSWQQNDTKKTEVVLSLLEKHHCVLIEQPFIKTDLTHTKTLKETTAIPIIADESCQRLADITLLKDTFDGINIKLQKCGGLTEAKRMITEARSYGLKVLIGCMSESSIGCSAAEAIAPLCDWADLDGPFLIENDDEVLRLTEKLMKF